MTSIAKTSPERQRVEMERVGRGERPLVKKVDVFDTTGYSEIGSRLPRSYGKVNKLYQAVARFADRLTPEDKAVAGPATDRFLSACGQLFQAVQRHYRARPANADDSAPAFNFKEWRDWSGAPDGGLHAPAAGLFDHKEPALADRNESCATRLVWDHLIGLDLPVQHLKPLVNVVYAGDSTRERLRFKGEFAESQRSGFHKAFEDAKSAHPADDAGVYRAVRQWLDRHDKTLATRRG